ncbi:protein cordon-bleu-like isoform X1 [Bufo gargarizans]|uniref:protein cordon-bleu-like isoform X1 n=2 Tax=Bufo gargarizans TaxID=30331 RepID=UPI001CF277A7|nr:protein cordon-bleu-like isoform X1 [Bufo gargarizans]
MSCVVLWQPAQDYVYVVPAVPGLSGAKKLSLSLGDLTKETKKTRDIGVTLGTYIVTPSKKTKAQAPLPPIQSITKPRMEHMSSSESEGTGNQNSDESKENLLHRKVELTICLPDVQEKHVTVDGSKAVMDLLVDLCSQHHLNPTQHTLEVRSGMSQQPFTLRPNTLIGTLDVETIFLKEKVPEVKVRKPPPKIPEKTIRLVVNFLGTQKAVVRVNPAVPLRNIFPAVCEKCELNQDNVILLRDVTNKEELDMSRSLNELGIRELYAWSSKQERNRNSDTAEKERKGIFGFFRSYKKGNKQNEGSIGNVDSDDGEEIFRTADNSGNTCEGFSTAPSSPSVNSRPIALGASLSLSNISGIGARSEIKKRRAPPPPKPAAPIVAVERTPEDMSTEPLYAAVQKEQQKKKRRAPPPPTSQTPNEKHEDLENRRSSTGNGRQVPQKPPRGNSRSPPQLMIPPPPPYPPPDNDIVDPPIFENGAAVTGPTRPIPAKREKRLIRCSSVSSEEVLTTDDAGSVNSYTEDLGIVSSPSDSTSLDLLNYSSKRRAKTDNQLDECKSSTDNVQPARAESFNSEDSWRLNTSSIRAEDEVSLVKSGDEEHFIAAQFQQTLAELDEDSEDMDDGDIEESNHTGTRTSPVGEESSHYTESSEHSAAVPVTIIDEVPEINALKYNPHNIVPVKEYREIQQSLANASSQNIGVPPEVDKTQKINSITYKTNRSFSQEGKSKVEYFKHLENHNTSDISRNNSSISTFEKQYIIEENLSSNPIIPAPSTKVLPETRPAIYGTNIVPEHKEEIEMKENRSLNNVHKTTNSTRPVLWRQQTYEPKVGMTTFTVVPPKPDIKKYDREVSLSASAIKIDDQGNLISPQSSFDKKHLKDSFINETDETLVEKPLLERAKEFWRSSSLESQAVESKEQTVKKLVSVKSYKPNQVPENKLNSTPFMGLSHELPDNKLKDTNNHMLLTKSAPKSSTPQEKMIIIENTIKGRTEASFVKPTVDSKFNGIQQTKPTKGLNENMTIIESIMKEKTGLQTTTNERPYVLPQTKPVQSSTTSQGKVIIIEQPNKERKDLPFLKSSKRTSSQYVASAISKYTEPVNKKTSETKLDSIYDNGKSKSNENIVEEPKLEIKAMKEATVHLKKNSSSSNGEFINRNLQMEPAAKIISGYEQLMAVKKEKSLSEQNGFNRSQSVLENTTATKSANIYSSAPAESFRVSRPASGLPSNAFLKAVREKSVKIEQANSVVPIKTPATVVTPKNEEKHDIDIIPSTVIDEPDSPSSSNIFGSKTRFRPVVQKPVLEDTSIHSALMGAIQSGEGKEKLRKIQSSSNDGNEKKFAEPENERSALLSAIRAHNGNSRLKKVSSAASDELQTLRSKEILQIDNEFVTAKTLNPSPLYSPPPPPPPVLNAAPKSPPVSLNSSVDTRGALLEAIRSGAGASRLKKVSASVRTL